MFSADYDARETKSNNESIVKAQSATTCFCISISTTELATLPRLENMKLRMIEANNANKQFATTPNAAKLDTKSTEINGSPGVHRCQHPL